MEITRDTVNAWLKQHPGRGRDWLAEQCGVGVSAVGHYLNTKGDARAIPTEHQLFIRKLMEEDAAASQAKPPHTLVLDFNDDQYAMIEKAALEMPETVREWAKRMLNEASALDVAEFVAPFLQAVQEPKTHWLPYFGTVAAGLPAGPTDVMDDTVAVAGGYDPVTHYVLRVHGQSMEPEYLDGSMIICRKLRVGEYPTKGQDVISSDASGSYFKRLAYVKDGTKGQGPRTTKPRLVSINPEYDEVIPTSDCPIVAVVVGSAPDSTGFLG